MPVAACCPAAASRRSTASLSGSRPNGPEIFTIVGESGSGKTTLARMVLAWRPKRPVRSRFKGTDLSTISGRRGRLRS